jgi:DNA repair ATPase RecN
MKYVLDILLIVGLLWVGHLWNNERKGGIELGDEIDRMGAVVKGLEKDLAESEELAKKTATELGEARSALEQAMARADETAATLAEKSAELDKFKEISLKLRARVAELEGYKSKAIVAEMPKPFAN